MSSRVHQLGLQLQDQREPKRILLWNGGFPIIVDGRFSVHQIFDVDPSIPKNDLLDWAAKNDVRCVGFGTDSRPSRGSIQRRENTWAVVS